MLVLNCNCHAELSIWGCFTLPYQSVLVPVLVFDS